MVRLERRLRFSMACVWLCSAATLLPTLVAAQPAAPRGQSEVFVSVGGGQVIYREQTYGDVGGGITLGLGSRFGLLC